MKSPEALAPNTVSFPLDYYGEIMTAMKLPLLVAEMSAIVGPCFWFQLLEEEDDSYLRRFPVEID
jgi:hypothetical protein